MRFILYIALFFVITTVWIIRQKYSLKEAAITIGYGVLVFFILACLKTGIFFAIYWCCPDNHALGALYVLLLIFGTLFGMFLLVYIIRFFNVYRLIKKRNTTSFFNAYKVIKNLPKEIKRGKFFDFRSTKKFGLNTKNLIDFYLQALGGNAEAQFAIGMLYSKNTILEKKNGSDDILDIDYQKKALFWLEKAAKQNIVNAQ